MYKPGKGHAFVFAVSFTKSESLGTLWSLRRARSKAAKLAFRYGIED
ncbi:MAG: hypothetical protein ACHQ6U_10070 [Thermodesulfobacteriota bacterium]